MHNNAPGGIGNDLGLDDISFAPAGPQTTIGISGTATNSLHVLCKSTFNLTSAVAACYVNNQYQWQNSADGITWNDIATATNPTCSVTVQTPGTYFYRLNVAENGNIAFPNCRVNSNAVTITVDNPVMQNITAAICPGGNYVLPSGKTVNTAGQFMDILPAQKGCDSIITTLNLKIDNVKLVDTNVSICSGGQYKLPAGKVVNSTGAYLDTLRYKIGCDSIITTTNLTVVGLTTVLSISASATSSCAGQPITFTAAPTNGGNAPAYQWVVNGNYAGTNSSTFSSSTLNDGDVVSCLMSSNATCATPANVMSNNIPVKIYSLPVANAGGAQTIKEGTSTILNAIATGSIIDITWSPSSGLSNNKILNPVANPVSTTIYTLIVQDANGCVGTDSAKVTVLSDVEIPNTFSPNGDGINDLWDIKNLKDYQNCLVNVFDRYGLEVYQSRGYFKPWDGTLNNKRLPVGTYYYVINLNNGTKPISGYVFILR
jgi:gliding motility-associated-like protein